MEGNTLQALLQEGVAFLETASIEDARFNAEELLCHVLGCGRTDLLLSPDLVVSKEQSDRYIALIKRRCDHYPLQYLLKEWDFYNCSFSVQEGVLIPRPETELLVDLGLTFLQEQFSEGAPAEVLDLCAGSGCIGITLERNFQNCHVTALEKSDQACDIIRTNMERNGTERYSLLQGDLFSGPAAYGIHRADLLLANPPYLTAEEMDSLQTEVSHEPYMALFGGEDGLDFYRAIASLYAPIMSPEGMVAVEIGETQSEQVSTLFAAFSENVEVLRDFAGLPRVVLAKPRFFLDDLLNI